MGFNNRRKAIEYFKTHNDGREPRLVLVGEDPFTSARICEQRLAQGVNPRLTKKLRQDNDAPSAEDRPSGTEARSGHDVPPRGITCTADVQASNRT